MTKILVFTSTRADYGLLSPLLKRLSSHQEIRLQLLVTGTHLLKEHGHSVDEIINDGFSIDQKIPLNMDTLSDLSTLNIMGDCLKKFGRTLKELQPDWSIVLGDRFEAFCFATAAYVQRKKIAHIAGGAVTAGAFDEAFRHSMSKMATLHFTSHETYRKRVIQLGEDPQRCFNVGPLAAENILKSRSHKNTHSLNKLLNINFKKPIVLCTYHPLTKDPHQSRQEIKNLLHTLHFIHDFQILFTAPNADCLGEEITHLILEKIKENSDRWFFYPSLGRENYLKMLECVSFVIGNSSSGMIEVPCYGIPTINIGNRQRGRISPESVIQCDGEIHSLKSAISRAQNPSFRKKLKDNPFTFGQGKASEQIVKTILKNTEISPVKDFFDLINESNQDQFRDL